MTALSTLAANNAGFGNILKKIQSGGAYIDPKGRVLSKTELAPIRGYSNTFSIRGLEYAYNEDGQMIEIPREPLQLYKFESAGDGKFTIPKLRNEKDGGYYKDITLNATKDGGNFTLEDKDTTATGQYFKATKGTDYSNQQWTGMSRGLANITNAVQTGEATVDSKKSIERWDDGQGNEGSREYYALRDGNGTEVGALYDVPGRPDLKYAKNVRNETAGGNHDVYLQIDPKSGAVAPIQDFSKQVTYNESQGKVFWQQQKEAAIAFAPLAAMIFAPVVGEAIGAALMEGGILTSASAAAASATTAAQAAAASAAATATATAVGTGIANATLGIVQGKPVDQAIGDAAINTAIQIGTPAAVGDIKNQIAQVTSNPAISNILTNATVSAGTALLKGKNAVDAFENGGTNALVNQIGVDIPGFADMNATAKKVVTDAINASVSGRDFKLTPEYMVNTLISTANKTAKNTQTANEKFNDTLGRPATEDELKQFATVETEEELNNSFAAYMDKLDAEAASQAQADAQAAIDAEVAAQAKAQEDAQAQAQADAQAAIDAETAKATQEAQEAEEQARRVAEFGKDLTGGGNQDLGEVDTNTDFYSEDSTGMGAYKYDEKSGTYTYTSDDGSTLTLDGDGNIVGHTESTDTPWMGITDQKTGNMNLPKLPTGITPNVNVNTMNQPDIGLPALSPLVAAGMFGALMQNQKSGYNPAPVQAPNVTMDWNPQPVQAPENGIAYGQQFLNPTYSTGAAGGGLMSLAAGGMTGKFTTLGSYSDGGRLLRGPGDGMSDNIPATIANRQPARLADGEFVVPADVVSHLGNGSTDAGAKVLYAMMDRVRKARTGKAKQGKKIQPQKFVPI